MRTRKQITNRQKSVSNRAEDILRARSVLTAVAREVRRLYQELKIHRVELNLYEDLHQAQVQLTALRDRCSDLWECSPVALFTLDKDGRILESNPTAATMLGVEKNDLLGTNLARFITVESLGNWYLHCRDGFSTEAKQVCEIRMRRSDNALLSLRAESIGTREGSDGRFRTALIDISQQELSDNQTPAVHLRMAA
jgi:PAS domain S-box-containing protein